MQVVHGHCLQARCSSDSCCKEGLVPGLKTSKLLWWFNCQCLLVLAGQAYGKLFFSYSLALIFAQQMKQQCKTKTVPDQRDSESSLAFGWERHSNGSQEMSILDSVLSTHSESQLLHAELKYLS